MVLEVILFFLKYIKKTYNRGDYKSSVAIKMDPKISEDALQQVITTKHLTVTDMNLINILSAFNTRWIAVSEILLESPSLENCEELLVWLRQQSVNNITRLGDKPLAGFSIIKTWLHDPQKKAVFFTLSPYLFR